MAHPGRGNQTSAVKVRLALLVAGLAMLITDVIYLAQMGSYDAHFALWEYRKLHEWLLQFTLIAAWFAAGFFILKPTVLHRGTFVVGSILLLIPVLNFFRDMRLP